MELPVTRDAGQPAATTPAVCRLLRSKGAPGVTYDDAVGWDAGYVSTATYWCLATLEPVGPDDGLVHAHACVARRRCFEPPDAGRGHEGAA